MLNDVRILDLSRLLPGPAATWMLAAHGALVDRVESKKGDLTRKLPPFVDGIGAYFHSVSHGKRSLCIDFRHPEFLGCMKRLVHGYDVLLEGFRPGVLEDMGLDPVVLQKENPRLIIVRLSGYGQHGVFRGRVGHDINYLAETGILAGNRVDNDGHALSSVQIADMAGALQASFQVAMALYARERNGLGRILDISLTESALAMYVPMLTGLLAEGRDAKEGREFLSGGASYYGTYRCKDGKYVAVGAVEEKFQAKLREKAGLLTRESLSAMFMQQPRDFWGDYFHDACVSPVLQATELEHSLWIQEQNLYSEGEF
ncbi:MAG: CoA transferase, partial [Deltaproteobacteria bacterium]|nr:CoA transferase [Deltaproteobacteria bacterium]